MEEELLKNGVVVIPFLDAKNLPNQRAFFHLAIDTFKEYIDVTHPVLGGFAAFGNPSSFHNVFVRQLREGVYEHVKNKLLRPYAQKVNLELRSEMLFDRMLLRRQGQNPTAESWHRDVCVKPPKSNLTKGDDILGGWLNLDNDNQFFSCVPGSHKDISLYDLTDGFATFPKDQTPVLQAHSQKILIPPGHLVIFYQYIAHEVLANKAKHDMYRLFHGFRLTMSDKALFEEDYARRRVFEDQAVPRLPSYQLPAMYSKNHQSMFTGLPKEAGDPLIGKFKLPGDTEKTNLIWWSIKTFKDVVLEEFARGRDGLKYIKVRREMKSLREYGLPLYSAYSGNEKALYRPQKLINMTTLDEDSDYEYILLRF
jgi:hypothetical protein